MKRIILKRYFVSPTRISYVGAFKSRSRNVLSTVFIRFGNYHPGYLRYLMVSALLRLRRRVMGLRLRRRLAVVVIVHHARVVQRRIPVVPFAGVRAALSVTQ